MSKPICEKCSNQFLGVIKGGATLWSEDVELENIGYHEWRCPRCGEIYEIDDDDEDESLSVYEAAEIWASYGKDEDYTFGYTEEELEDAL